MGGRLAQKAGPALGRFEIGAVQHEFFGRRIIGGCSLHAFRVAAVADFGEAVADYYLENFDVKTTFDVTCISINLHASK